MIIEQIGKNEKRGRMSTLRYFWTIPHVDFAKTKKLGSVSISARTASELTDFVKYRLMESEGFALATLNLDHIVKLSKNTEFLNAYSAHDIITADGFPIVWASKIALKPVQRLTGSDMIKPLLRIADMLGKCVGIFGSDQETLRIAGEVLIQEMPTLKIVYLQSPPYGFDPGSVEARAYLEQISRANVDLCFLALGAPKQEIFASLGRDACPSVGFISIGAGIDFIAGKQMRAPMIFQRIGAEWAWRLMRDPNRLAKRYALCTMVLPILLFRALKMRFNMG